MKNLIIISLVAATTIQVSLASILDPISLYGAELRFSIHRNGDPVGAHIVKFQRSNDKLNVLAESKITVRFMKLPVYKFTYHSDSIWHRGKLLKLLAKTDDNGDVSLVRFEANSKGGSVSGPNGQFNTLKDIIPTNHWYQPAVLTSMALNTVTGRLNNFEVVDLGWDEVLVQGRAKKARRYAYVGELEIEVWYDSEGRWVRLRFNNSGDSVLEYICEGWSIMSSDTGY